MLVLVSPTWAGLVQRLSILPARSAWRMAFDLARTQARAGRRFWCQPISGDGGSVMLGATASGGFSELPVREGR